MQGGIVLNLDDSLFSCFSLCKFSTLLIRGVKETINLSCLFSFFCPCSPFQFFCHNCSLDSLLFSISLILSFFSFFFPVLLQWFLFPDC